MANKKAYIELHTAVFLFGFTGILGQLIELNSNILVWHRLWMAALGMLGYVLLIGKWRLLSAKEIVRITAVSSVIVVHWLLFYGSIKLASVSVAMICLSTIALFTAILDPIIHRKPIAKAELVLSVFAVLGVTLMAEDQKQHLLGIAVGLASAFFSALFTVLNKSLVDRYDSRLLSFYELFTGFLLLCVLLPIVNVMMPLGKWTPSGSDWLYLALLSFFCTVIAFNLSLSSLRFLSPFTVNLSINLEPVYGIALAFVVFQEYRELGLGFYLGAGLILASVLADVVWKKRRR
ncbi:MAG: DMT family transporter [Bacteroidia bacterium]|jgi:drug/metabolite transporter (DMT)-like permease